MTRTGVGRLMVALDTSDLLKAVRAARRLRGVARYVKIGSALFTAAGPVAIARMRAMGFEVFLDLKYHDIPSTVEKSCRAAVRHRVAMLTVHASGQPEMLRAAISGVRQEARRVGGRRPLVVGVTVLTSIDAGGARGVTQRVLALASEAKRAGLDGVVCSAQEARAVRRRFRRPFAIICPGIRRAGTSAADQQRVASPAQALAHGADFLVVGRPILEAKNPREAAQQILNDMEDECAC